MLFSGTSEMHNLLTAVVSNCADIIGDARTCTSECQTAINELNALGTSLDGCKETHIYYHSVNKIIDDAAIICANGYVPNGSLKIQLVSGSVTH